MDAAIWYVIGDSVMITCGLLIAVAFVFAVHITVLDGIRTERYSPIRRLQGVLRDLEK